MTTTSLDPKAEARFQPRRIAIPLLICGVIALAYAPSFEGVFLFDDFSSIQPDFFTSWRPKGDVATRPLVYWSFFLNYQTGGMSTFGYHAVNLAIHCAVALTLLGIWRRTMALDGCADRWSGTEKLTLPIVAALLWGLHPLATQAVTYIVQRCESLAALLCLFSLYCFIRADHSKDGRKFWYATSIVSWALATTAKEWGAIWPLVILLYDRTFLTKSSFAALRRRPRFYSLLSVVGVFAIAWIGYILTRATSVGFELKTVSALDYACSQPGVILHYLRLTFVPDPLCLDYRWLIARGFWGVGVPALSIAAIGAFGIWGLWRRTTAGFLIATFFIVLAPTSSFLPIADLAFEHRMYLPLAAVTSLTLLGGYSAARRVDLSIAQGTAPIRFAFSGGLLVTLLAFGLLTARRNIDYSNEVVMWSTVIQARPHNYRAWSNLGNAYLHLNRYEEALGGFNQALRFDPSYTLAMYGAAVCYDNLGKTLEAERMYRSLLKRDSIHLAAAYNNLGLILAKRKEFVEAERCYRAAIALDAKAPNRELNGAKASFNLGLMVDDLGRRDDAILLLEAALVLDPSLERARKRLEALKSSPKSGQDEAQTASRSEESVAQDDSSTARRIP
jgi:tetratricopeptide (TPR) repeat protein